MGFGIKKISKGVKKGLKDAKKNVNRKADTVSGKVKNNLKDAKTNVNRKADIVSGKAKNVYKETKKNWDRKADTVSGKVKNTIDLTPDVPDVNVESGAQAPDAPEKRASSPEVSGGTNLLKPKRKGRKGLRIGLKSGVRLGGGRSGLNIPSG